MKTVLTLSSVFLLACSMCVAASRAQGASQVIADGKALLKAGYDAADVGRMQQARAVFERAAQDDSLAYLAHYYAALAEQRIVNLLYASDPKTAAPHLDAAIDHADKASQMRNDWAEPYVLLANLYGQKSSLDPMEAMTYGPRADAALARAMRLDPRNPRAALIDGLSLYHRPAAFGGSKEEALAAFEDAVRLFEQGHGLPADPLMPSWGRAEAYAWIGIARHDAGDDKAARAAFDKALEIDPNSGWIRNVLMPQLGKADEAH